MNIDNAYVEEKTLAEGNYGQVKLMYHKSDPSLKYAVKIYSKNNAQDAQVRHFRQELKIKSFEHPHIIKLIDFNENGKGTGCHGETCDVRYAVLELAPNGNLLDYISYNALDKSIVQYYFKQLCEAVDYIHKQGVCHRDLKLENLLLDQDYNLKVSDFGFCTEIINKFGDKVLSTCKGTPGYMAPEMMNIGGFNYVTNQKSHKLFNSNGYSGVQSDVFALGVILFSLLIGRPPFKIADINDPFYRLIFTHQTMEFWSPWDQFAEQNNFKIGQDFKDLFISMVAYCPLMRLSLNEVLSSKWMKEQGGKSSKIPSSHQVSVYMSQIQKAVEEHENQQLVCLQETVRHKASTLNQPKTEETKKESSVEDNLNDSCLSSDSHFHDDDQLIMKDLQDIEKELYENDGIEGDSGFNLDDHEDFALGSGEFDLDENYNNFGETQTSTNSTKVESVQQPSSQMDVLEVLDNMLEVDAEIRTQVPEKMISFLTQFGKMNQWKMVQISNYFLLKIPDSNSSVVEYALKFDQVDESQYALKFLKNETISDELFHSVGSSILELLAPYC